MYLSSFFVVERGLPTLLQSQKDPVPTFLLIVLRTQLSEMLNRQPISRLEKPKL